ncbi:MAG: hypothetical protein ACK55Z_27895, partial [bacterium]
MPAPCLFQAVGMSAGSLSGAVVSSDLKTNSFSESDIWARGFVRYSFKNAIGSMVSLIFIIINFRQTNQLTWG